MRTGEVTVTRAIILHVHQGGATEKTMLHELAHAMGSRWEGHGPAFGERCLKLQAIWLDIIAAAPSYYAAADKTSSTKVLFADSI